MVDQKSNNKRKKIILILLALFLILGIGTFSVRAVQNSRVNNFLDLGNKYLLDANYEQAVLQFENVLKIDKKNVDARVGLSKAYTALKKPDKAVAVLKDGIKLTRKMSKLYLALGDTYVLQGNTEEAIKAYDEGYGETKNEELKKKLDEIKATIEITIEKNPLQVGNTTAASLVQKDKDGNVIKELDADWKSKDSKIGSISKDGALKAVYKAAAAGKDELSAYIGKVEFKKEVDVKDKVLERLEITSESTEGSVGDAVKFKVTGYDQLGEEMEVTPTWQIGGELAQVAKTEGQYATLNYVKDGQFVVGASVDNIKEDVNVSIQKRKYTVVTIISGKGTIVKDPNTEVYIEDTKLTLKAVPERGWHFSKWTGTVERTANPMVITINSNNEIKAVFAINKYTLNTDVSGEGDISRNIYKSSYDYGTKVKLTAVPRAGYKFDHWEGSASGTNPVVTIQMSNNKKVKAVFIQDGYFLQIEKTGEGEVKRNETKASYQPNEVVQLTAVPAAGFKFDHWERNANGKNSVTSIKMDTNKKVRAVFVPADYNLSLEVSGDGAVLQEKLPDGKIKLTAKAEEGSTFSRWEGDLTGSGNPSTIDITSPKQVKAIFVNTTTKVNVSVTGKGKVEQTKPSDSKIQLKAVPLDGWSFDHWEGDLTGSVNPIIIDIGSANNVKAVFKEPSTQKSVTVYPGEKVIAGYIDVPAGANILEIEASFGTISGDEWPDLDVKAPTGENFGYNGSYLQSGSSQIDSNNKSSSKATYNGWSAENEKMTFEHAAGGRWYVEIDNTGGEKPSTFIVKSNYLIYSE